MTDRNTETHERLEEKARARARRRRQELHEQAASAVYYRRSILAERYRQDARAIQGEWEL